MEKFNQWYINLYPAALEDPIGVLTKCILYNPPPLTTIRVDLTKISPLNKALFEIQASINELNGKLVKLVHKKYANLISHFTAWIDADKFPDVIFISSGKLAVDSLPYYELPFVVVDQRTGQSVLRGANIYFPGIITANHFTHYQTTNSNNDNYDDKYGDGDGDNNSKLNLVNVYADTSKEILHGAKVSSNLESLNYLGIGISSASSREELLRLKNSSLSLSNTMPAIQMLSGLIPLESDKYSLQNLPSILVGRILFSVLKNNFKQEELKILDACSGYGGKTKHLAELFPNSQILAVERSLRKVNSCKEMLVKSKHFNVSVLKGDVSKLCGEKFNAIILDPPCSGIGQRPILSPALILSPSEEKGNFSLYQKYLLKCISEMAEQSAPIIYSTCTLSPNENEEVVSWALANLDLSLKKITLNINVRRGIPTPFTSLSLENAEKCVRFIPEINYDKEGSKDYDYKIIDSIAFFIACFIKN